MKAGSAVFTGKSPFFKGKARSFFGSRSVPFANFCVVCFSGFTSETGKESYEKSHENHETGHEEKLRNLP